MSYRLVLSLLLLAGAPLAHAMQCAGGATHLGDYDDEISQRCGDPFWADSYNAYEADGTARQPGVRATRYTSWYYNFGSAQAMIRLVFRDGRLEREQKLRPGVDKIGASCSLSRNVRGLSSGELVALCGKPAAHADDPDMNYPMHACTDYSHLNRTYGEVAPYCAQEHEDDSQDWVYDFGAATYYVVRLINGNVDDVERQRR